MLSPPGWWLVRVMRGSKPARRRRKTTIPNARAAGVARMNARIHRLRRPKGFFFEAVAGTACAGRPGGAGARTMADAGGGGFERTDSDG